MRLPQQQHAPKSVPGTQEGRRRRFTVAHELAPGLRCRVFSHRFAARPQDEPVRQAFRRFQLKLLPAGIPGPPPAGRAQDALLVGKQQARPAGAGLAERHQHDEGGDLGRVQPLERRGAEVGQGQQLGHPPLQPGVHVSNVLHEQLLVTRARRGRRARRDGVRGHDRTPSRLDRSRTGSGLRGAETRAVALENPTADPRRRFLMDDVIHEPAHEMHPQAPSPPLARQPSEIHAGRQARGRGAPVFQLDPQRIGPQAGNGAERRDPARLGRRVRPRSSWLLPPPPQSRRRRKDQSPRRAPLSESPHARGSGTRRSPARQSRVAPVPSPMAQCPPKLRIASSSVSKVRQSRSKPRTRKMWATVPVSAATRMSPPPARASSMSPMIAPKPALAT